MASQEQWFALYTKPHKEYAVLNHLAGRQVEVFMPETCNQTQRRDRPARRPFFPHYLFARLDPSDGGMERVRWTPGVRTIVSFGGVPAPIPDEVVARIRRQVAQRAEESPDARFKRGQRLQVAHGPFEGLEAVFDRRLSPSGRVRVFLECLHRLTAAELDQDDLLASR